MDKKQLREEILEQIERPKIPNITYSVLQFGVVPNGEQVQTASLQQAIDWVSASGGGKLVLPAGRYYSGALRMKSKVELHLESQDTMLFFVNQAIEFYYPLVLSYWEATPCYNFSSLLYAYKETDIAVTGKGVLDGGADAEHWWNWHHQVEQAWSDNRQDLQLVDRRLLRKMNEDGVPIEQRRFGDGHYLRPNFVQIIQCERVLIQGVTLKNSPMWQLNPVMCKSVTVDGVTMSSHGANNDGCDPESCNGVYIYNCRFDTGDDCISLKSGRDRDGRMANRACENILIEQNEFADGHGGIALGSEMSGGIRRVVAVDNYFRSPHLNYALRLKSNARRGGRVEEIILADSVIDSVHGAAVHGTMLYEDGRNGCYLPVFQNILIENIKAYGGDYGIFLEAFREVPIRGLVLRNIQIDGVQQLLYSRNWENPVIEQVIINGKRFPRPGYVQILGVPIKGNIVTATAKGCGEKEEYEFYWQSSLDGIQWKEIGKGKQFLVPENAIYLSVRAVNGQGESQVGHCYLVLEQQNARLFNEEQQRLICRGMLKQQTPILTEEKITRQQLAEMLMPLANPKFPNLSIFKEKEEKEKAEGREECQKEKKESKKALQAAVEKGFLALTTDKQFFPEGYVTRQEMATVAMQACGVNYHNASSTMPVCADVEKVGNHYGTNVARSLYFGFMELEKDGCFDPERLVTMKEAIEILNRVADFAGI